jgi:hypothetical protein
MSEVLRANQGQIVQQGKMIDYCKGCVISGSSLAWLYCEGCVNGSKRR